MRKQLSAAVLPLLLLIAFGETQNPGPASQAVLQKVNVVRNGDSVRVEILGRGQWAAKVMSLESPSRVVVVLPDTTVDTPYNRINVDSRIVKAVRIGSDARMPPTTSVVIDCVETCRYDLLPSGSDQVILRLSPGGASTATLAPSNEAPARESASEKPTES